jgi:hypothetical protein
MPVIEAAHDGNANTGIRIRDPDPKQAGKDPRGDELKSPS